jgi:hypothetical protein
MSGMRCFNFLFIGFILIVSSCDKSNASYDPNKMSKGVVQFDKSSHDFGTLKEEDGFVTHKFTFKNTGTEPLFITKVVSSCGCTSPDWTKEAIKPGETGFVEAKYNPEGHPGIFNKALTVMSNTADSVLGLFISGQVIEKQKTISELYKDSLGALRIGSKYLNFLTVNNNESVVKEFKIFNSSDKHLTFTIHQLPPFLKVSLIPKTLPSKSEGILQVVLDPKKIKELGSVHDVIDLSTNDQNSPIKRLYFTANLIEYFPPLSKEELLKAPKIVLDKFIHDFGKVKKGSLASTQFLVKNEGKKDLLIRAIQPSCYCTNADIDKKSIKPGEVAKVTVVYDSKDISLGPDTKTIAIYCNDPTNSNPALVINTTVVQ